MIKLTSGRELDDKSVAVFAVNLVEWRMNNEGETYEQIAEDFGYYIHMGFLRIAGINDPEGITLTEEEVRELVTLVHKQVELNTGFALDLHQKMMDFIEATFRI